MFKIFKLMMEYARLKKKAEEVVQLVEAAAILANSTKLRETAEELREKYDKLP